MATIHDVAKHAGVSSATVSHVINKSRYVSDEVQERVNESIKALNYQRDGIARSLRRNKTGTIGLAISDITNPYFSEIYKGVYEELTKHDADNIILISNTNEDSDREKARIEMFQSRRIDGVIVAPSGNNVDWYNNTVVGKLPTVFVDRYLSSVNVDYVIAENHKPAFELTSHLIKLGHQSIAVLRADIEASTIYERIDGYKAALTNAQLPFRDELIFHAKSDIQAACTVSLEMLQCQDRPSAVLCTNDFMLLGLFKALTKLRLKCPDDIAVVGFDDFPWAEDFQPRLTVASQPEIDIGRQAEIKLIARMTKNGLEAEVDNVVLPTKVIIRDSCGST